MKLAELAEKIEGRLVGPGDVDVLGAAPFGSAQGTDIAFLSDAGFLKEIDACRAAAIIVSEGLEVPDTAIPLLFAKNARYAFAKALALLYGTAHGPAGIDSRAEISPKAVIGRDVTVHPFVVVADGARIGDRVVLYPGVYVGRGSSIGDDSLLYSNVSVREGVSVGHRVIVHAGTVLGSDGFGFVTEAGTHHKIPQVGGVLIEDDVEIGANCAIDRATLGTTIVKKGTKIDNLVHIAHNVTVGEHCLLAGQVGIAGSTTLGSYVVLGGQAGVADHTSLGDRVMAGGGSVITRDVDPGMVIAGVNAMPLREWLKVQAVLPRLPEIRKRLAEIERLLKGRTDTNSSGEGKGQ